MLGASLAKNFFFEFGNSGFSHHLEQHEDVKGRKDTQLSANTMRTAMKRSVGHGGLALRIAGILGWARLRGHFSYNRFRFIRTCNSSADYNCELNKIEYFYLNDH